VTIPYADIAAIETRLEAYGSLGMEIMQRAYVLHRKSRELIFLFEERGLATALASSLFGDIAAELAKRAGVAVKDHGMAAGRGGLLCTWSTHAPDWAAPALSPERQRQLWARRHDRSNRSCGHRHRAGRLDKRVGAAASRIRAAADGAVTRQRRAT
jgi:hypothetical protein